MAARQIPTRQSGFTLLEALISMLIIALGLLGLAGLQVRMQQAEFESYQRSQALVLLYDMVERIQTNRITASCFRVTSDAAAGTPFLGTGGTVPSCSAGSETAMNADAVASMTEWQNLLLGAAETKGGAKIGAILDARGCISYSGPELSNASGTLGGTGIYTVTIAWQGTVDTVDTTATVPCAKASYANAKQRRVVSTTFRLANLK